MDLQLTRRGDYAVRAALHLGRRAEGGDGFVKLREISEAMAIPRSYVAQVLGFLTRAGLAEARAGRDGGYRLTRPPADITLLEVVEAAEGLLLPARCTLRGGACRVNDQCVVHPAWFRAAEALRDSLRTTSLAEVSHPAVHPLAAPSV